MRATLRRGSEKVRKIRGKIKNVGAPTFQVMLEGWTRKHPPPPGYRVSAGIIRLAGKRLACAGMIELTSERFSQVKMSGVYQSVTPPPPRFSQVTKIKNLKSFTFYQFEVMEMQGLTARFFGTGSCAACR